MYRKQFYDSFPSLLLGLLIGFAGLLSSCSETELNATSGAYELLPEIPTTVTLPLQVNTASVVTRAALIGDEDRHIYNVWLFVFDLDGENGRLYRFDNPGTSLQFTTTSGYRRIYAIANVDELGEVSRLSHDLTAVNSVKSLKQVMAHMATLSPFRNAGHLLMSGIYHDDSDNAVEGYCKISPAKEISLEPIRLDRISSRITFNISLDPSDPEVSLKSFTPVSWKVVNMPADCPLFPSDTETASVSADYFQMPDSLPFEDILTDELFHLPKGTFTFYSMENNQHGKGATRWSDREMKAADVHGMRSETFKYAPLHATYVELRGRFEYEYEDAAQDMTVRQVANVKYTIHLGYVGQDPYNNYECRRNTSYTYNILVRGVDDLILKVERDNPDDPNDLPDVEDPNEPGNGVDGDVVVYRQKQMFDAHYDRSILSFNKQNVMNKSQYNGFFIRTPFCDGNFYIDDDGQKSEFPGALPDSEACDYDWAKFRRCDMMPDSTYRTSFSLYDPTNIVDVKGLIKDLRRGYDNNGYAVYDKNGNAYYTLFIDENYYTVDPRTGEPAPADFWKQFVNQPPRELGILSDLKMTLEGNSSLSFCDTYIRQNSIRTIYETSSDASLQTAWGVETLNETGQFPISRFNPWETVDPLCANSIMNQSQAYDLIGKEWAKYLSTDINESNQRNQLNLNSDVSPFLYACIQRNRDTDGDGIIDLDELKWLPASDTHYLGMWIGKTSLPQEAQLYPDGSRDYRRYLSANGREILAEEGESTDEYGTLSYNGYIGVAQPRTYDYRCIRLLGFEHYHSVDDQAQSYAQVDAMQHLIRLDWLASLNYRTSEFYIEEAQQSSPANSYYNYPYSAFYYRDVDTTTDTIPAGWRLPNDREMAILCDLIADGWGDDSDDICYYPTASQASSYLTGKAGCTHWGVSKRLADGRHIHYMELSSSTPTTQRIRCVRDAR